MVRVTGAPASRKRRKRILKRAKGFFGDRKNHIRQSSNAVMSALAFSYRHRKLKKRGQAHSAEQHGKHHHRRHHRQHADSDQYQTNEGYDAYNQGGLGYQTMYQPQIMPMAMPMPMPMQFSPGPV